MARNMRTVVVTTLAAGALLATAACRQPEEPARDPRPAAPAAQPAPTAPAQPAAPAEPAAPVEVSPAAMEEARATYQNVCVTCHGASGEGDGPASAGFPVKPRSFSDPEWQNSVTDQQIATVIVQGGPAIGRSPLMPGNPQLQNRPEVVQGLVQMVRGFGQQGGQQ